MDVQQFMEDLSFLFFYLLLFVKVIQMVFLETSNNFL